jgi:hypothetical protein
MQVNHRNNFHAPDSESLKDHDGAIRATVLNMNLKVTSYFIVFSVKNLILQKIHINVFMKETLN